jgi:hypothetical protein
VFPESAVSAPGSPAVTSVPAATAVTATRQEQQMPSRTVDLTVMHALHDAFRRDLET